MRLLTLLTAACCLLTGCAAGTMPMPDLSVPVKTQPPANLTAPPRQLPAAASGQMRDLEANHQAVTKEYHRLASQMCGLLDYLQVSHPECAAFRRAAPPKSEP